MDKKHQLGTINEYKAAVYLASIGYYIFKSITSSTSPIDIVAINPKNNECLYVDVKTVSIRKQGKKKGTRINRILTKEQKKLGVQILHCYEDGTFKWQGKGKNGKSNVKNS